MNFPTVTLLTLALASSPAQALDLTWVPEDWSRENTYLELGYGALAVLDAGTTSDIHNRSDIYEVAPITKNILGQQPGRTETAFYFAGLIGIHYGISALLPARYRTIWQRTTLTVQAGVVASNYHAGLTWGF